jgi:hypothetical protein
VCLSCHPPTPRTRSPGRGRPSPAAPGAAFSTRIVYKRLRQRNISERSIWAAIRNATSCIAYVPERGPLANGTSWRIAGPDDEGEVTSVGVETFLDHLGRRLLVITVF